MTGAEMQTQAAHAREHEDLAHECLEHAEDHRLLAIQAANGHRFTEATATAQLTAIQGLAHATLALAIETRLARVKF